MSSIFTFDPSPSHPVSPWDTPSEAGQGENGTGGLQPPAQAPRSASVSPALGMSSLVSESELGACEYKLTLIGAKSKERFEQLTTQLLWRLQQSSPYHGSSTGTDVASPEAIATMLQDSQGALYEIGVADDGTFVGLDEDELAESLECLEDMASRLGCGVQILRKVEVRQRHEGERPYWVVEAFVKPEFGNKGRGHSPLNVQLPDSAASVPPLELLRVSFIGATGAGKSTLLGSLVTGSLDNGRGRARLSLFRHRHELVSGVTSSLSHEIIGYRSPDSQKSQVIHDTSSDHSSWGDICAAASASGGRVVVGTDSAGVPRYRRTVLRSLVGWAPHYAVFFISAEAGEQFGADSADLSLVYLNLLLKLDIPFLVLVTKLDIATKQSLRSTLAKVMAVLKEQGRRPVLLPSAQPTATDDFDGWTPEEQKKAKEVSLEMQDRLMVPLLFTSSVRGDGMGILHAILANVPVPPLKAQRNMILFHIDEVFDLHTPSPMQTAQGVVISGYMRHGTVSVGDEVLVGPFDGGKDGTLKTEWARFKVTSARRLRSPVHHLGESDVGSIGLVSLEEGDGFANTGVLRLRLRKGMVVTGVDPEPLEAKTTFRAELSPDPTVQPLASGAQVMVYNASIRAAAEVLMVDEPLKNTFTATFKLLARREWMEASSRVYIVPGGGKTFSSTGLEGFAGIVVDD